MKIFPEEKLIEFAKPYLKEKGYKKKNKRWIKDIGEFTLSFYIQGSQWDKDDYYIRPGVFINRLGIERMGLSYYGHFTCDIRNDLTINEIFEKFEQFCVEWTDKKLIKARAKAYKEWEDRNPLDKRRSNLVDYNKDPVPTRVLSGKDTQFIDWLIKEL